MHFYGLNLGPSGAGPSWILGPLFEKKLVKDYQAMLHTEFQESKPCSSEEKDF